MPGVVCCAGNDCITALLVHVHCHLVLCCHLHVMLDIEQPGSIGMGLQHTAIQRPCSCAVPCKVYCLGMTPTMESCEREHTLKSIRHLSASARLGTSLSMIDSEVCSAQRISIEPTPFPLWQIMLWTKGRSATCTFDAGCHKQGW